MRKLIRMEFEKLFSSRMIYICLFLLFMIIPLTYGFKLLLIAKGFTSSAAIEAFYNMSLQDYLLISWKNEISSGLIFFLISIAVSVITVDDYVHGTQKYLLLATSRNNVAVGKTVSVILTSGLMALSIVVSSIIVGAFTKPWDASGANVGFLFLAMLVFIGITVVFALIVNYIALFVDNGLGVIGSGILILAVFYSLPYFLPRKLLFMSFLLHTEAFPNVGVLGVLGSLAVLITYTAVFFSLNYRKLRKKAYYL